VVVAAGEPGAPVVCCWAKTPTAVEVNNAATNTVTVPVLKLALVFML